MCIDRQNEHPSPLILAYHSISQTRTDNLTVSAADFRRQMEWLSRSRYETVTLSQYVNRDNRRTDRSVVITFDDGYADNYTTAFPILRDHGFVATVFLVSDYVGTDHIYWWDEPKAGHDRSPYRLLSWNEVHEMEEYGIEFGSHSCTHRKLTQIPASQQAHEIRRSRADLQAMLRREVVSFCYPAGDLNSHVVKAVEDAGYRCGVVTPTASGLTRNRFTLRRVGVYYPNSWFVFRLKVSRLIRCNYERILGIRRKFR